MSAPVNALAVLRAARDSVPAEQLLDYCAAVAAMAELIDANVELAAANADPAHTLGRDLRVINAEKRLRAALARVQGRRPVNWVFEGDRVRIRDSWEGGHVENTETIDVPYQGTQAQLVMVRMDENNHFKTFWNHELEVIR